MIQRINHKCNIFTHIAANIIRPLQKLRRLIDQVRCKNRINQSVLISLIKLLKPVRKQPEGCSREDPSCLALLQLARHIQNAVSRGDHIIQDNHILALHRGTQEFMGNNRVAPVHNPRVITSLVEHPHVKIQHICKIDRASGCAFIRTDGHHMVIVNLKVIITVKESLYKLIGGLDRLKAA